MVLKYLLLVLAFLLTSCEAQNLTFQGYVEGDYVFLASSRAGRLIELPALKGSYVTQNTLLFRLEAESELQALKAAEATLLAAQATLEDMERGRRPEEVAMAEAQLRQARADASNAAIQLRRDQNLRLGGGVSQKTLDDALARAKSTQAKVAELESQVDVFNLPERDYKVRAQRAIVAAEDARVRQARWDLGQKEMLAPKAGLIVDTLYRVGEWVNAGNPVVQMLPPDNVKVRFFVPEEVLARILLGMEVNCQADGLSGQFAVQVVWIAPNAEYTPPIIYSNETRSKLCFMVEAKPNGDLAKTLHPGQPLTVSLP